MTENKSRREKRGKILSREMNINRKRKEGKNTALESNNKCKEKISSKITIKIDKGVREIPQ